MVARGTTLPEKLKHDSIAEALLEIRFDMGVVPEVLFARLADHPSWKEFSQRPLAAYNLPAPMRESDINLRYQPILELVAPDGKRALKVGTHVISYHRLQDYIGWEKFKIELDVVVDALFERAMSLTVKRLGLRYVNVLNAERHGIKSISDLDLKVTIADTTLAGNVNLNFTTRFDDENSAVVRIATPDFVQGLSPDNMSLLIDVDVFTSEKYQATNREAVKAWVTLAHKHEKQEFFRLLTQTSIDHLKEK